MIFGERGILKKLSWNPNLKMIFGERGI
jgi:hypothetical protein